MSALTPPQARFQQLARQWKADARYMSNTAQMAMLRPYQRIIGLGPPAVPLILEELRREPNHWFWALESITDENPVPPQDIGYLDKMTQTWINWGVNEGLIT
jgi:hypothetical protein